MEKVLRKEILEKVKEYYKEVLEPKQKKYIEGKSLIPFAGRVYDESELINLVDSSLDFWLTAGRYAEEFEESFAKYMEQKYCRYS